MRVVPVVDSAAPASTRWNDYVGTVAADDRAAVAGTKSMYELTGLDRDRWIIVGLDIVVTASSPQIVVFAAACTDDRNRVEHLLDTDDTLPVTAHTIVDGRQVQSILDEGFGSLAIRLRPRSLDHPLSVTGHHGLESDI